MTRSTSKHLKLYAEPMAVAPPPASSFNSLPAVLESFQQATGWTLRYTGARSVDGSAGGRSSAGRSRDSLVGHFTLDCPDSAPPVARQSAQSLAAALAQLLGEAISLEQALWRREAELATAVPVIPAANERQHLAERLEAVLKGGAEAAGCQAAGLYLLDEGTSELKLRACWGLHLGRLAVPARPLRGAVADLEALLGSAVTLENETLMDTWRAPEPFAAGLCVPVSSATTILGTLWIFSEQPRRFSDRQANLAEIIAGRLAADLEREILLGQGIDAARWRSQLTVAENLQREQLPSTSPLIDGWELAGWTEQAQAVGGDFFDWFCRSDDSTVVALGDAAGQGLPAALVASALKASLRSHAQHLRMPDEILAQANQTLWTGSAGDQRAAAVVALLRPDDDRVSLSMAGPIHAFVLGQPADDPAGLSPRLGEAPDLRFAARMVAVRPGQTLVLFTAGLCGSAADREAIVAALSSHASLAPRELAQLLRTRLETGGQPCQEDHSLVVLRRAGSSS